jgi:hypothetical protein
MTSLVRVSSAVVEDTLRLLRDAGVRKRELVVAWLGRRGTGGIEVRRLSVPVQSGTTGSFKVSEEGMRRLRAEMATQGELVAAQIHAHPDDAFHSLADDRGALVGHLGALSIVLPNFAADTSIDNFMVNAAIFELQGTGIWCQISAPIEVRINDLQL